MLHVVYRSSGGANRKNRPDFFDKDLCLASFLRAVREAGAPVAPVFLNDGPLPEARVRWMAAAGEVVAETGLGNGGSYRRAVDLALDRARGEDDLAYLSEDDYLFLPEAFSGLLGAAASLPEADYLSLYDHPDRYRRTDDADRGRARVYAAGDRHWRSAESTCLSFAVRPAALSEDAPLHRRAARAEIPDDRGLWRRLQGLGGRRLLRAGRTRRLLVTPLPALATHLEREHLAPMVDWNGVAARTREWAERSLG